MNFKRQNTVILNFLAEVKQKTTHYCKCNRMYMSYATYGVKTQDHIGSSLRNHRSLNQIHKNQSSDDIDHASTIISPLPEMHIHFIIDKFRSES